MAVVSVDGETVRMRLSPWERLGALRGDLAFPRRWVDEVRVVPSALRAVRGLRAPGTGCPGVIALGTFRGRGYRDFAAAYRNRPGVVVELSGGPYARLVLSLDHPESVARSLRS
ncbi:MAG: hypothetical protein ACRDYU_19395 [Actinomycetes bacterium]